jgi:hypothetical protein
VDRHVSRVERLAGAEDAHVAARAREREQIEAERSLLAKARALVRVLFMGRQLTPAERAHRIELSPPAGIVFLPARELTYSFEDIPSYRNSHGRLR